MDYVYEKNIIWISYFVVLFNYEIYWASKTFLYMLKTLV